LCEYCFDVSESTNTDAIAIDLYDVNGTSISVNLDENNCIPLDQLTQNTGYNVNVTALNTSMIDNVECTNATQAFSFWVPTPPFRRFPCFGILVTQKNSNSSGTTNFTINNTGNSREFNINSIETNTGNLQVISNSIFVASGQEIDITIPNPISIASNNQLIIESEGQSINVSYVPN
jgi:hypothetical protein